MQIILLIAWQRDSWMFNRLAVKLPLARVETEVRILFGQLPTTQPDWGMSGTLDVMFERRNAALATMM